jgi:hypothetical protein
MSKRPLAYVRSERVIVENAMRKLCGQARRAMPQLQQHRRGMRLFSMRMYILIQCRDIFFIFHINMINPPKF